MIRVVQGTAGIFHINNVKPDKKILEEALKSVKVSFSVIVGTKIGEGR